MAIGTFEAVIVGDTDNKIEGGNMAVTDEATFGGKYAVSVSNAMLGDTSSGSSVPPTNGPFDSIFIRTSLFGSVVQVISVIWEGIGTVSSGVARIEGAMDGSTHPCATCTKHTNTIAVKEANFILLPDHVKKKGKTKLYSERELSITVNFTV